MEYYQIRYFVTVAKLQSYQRAAQELFVTRQAIGRGILQLEEEIGYPLFFRTKSGIHLTPQASGLLAQAQSLVASMDQLETAMHTGVGSKSQRLRLDYSFTSYALHESALNAFQLAHAQDVVLTICGSSEQKCREKLLNDETDVAMTTLPVPDCACHLFAEYPISLLISKENPLAQKERIEPQDLQGETFLAYQSGTDEPLYVPDHIRFSAIPQHCILSDDLIYLFKRVQENRGILMSVEANMRGMVEGTVFRLYPPAGTWKHFLSLSPAASQRPGMTMLYTCLFDAMAKHSESSDCQ